MRKREKISKSERLEISILLGKNYSLREIARALGRSPNSISYEVRKNSVSSWYDPEKAHHKARTRKKCSRFQWRKINKDKVLQDYIVRRMGSRWNPDEISGRMRKERRPFYASKTAIYEWLYSERGRAYTHLLYSERKRRKKRKPRVKREMIPQRVSIDKRPLGAMNRTRYGHFEADALLSGRSGSGVLAVVSERKSKLLLAEKAQSLRPAHYRQALEKTLNKVRVRSFTFDNGLENREHWLLEVATFFCDAYSAWQKGGVENANKMLRHYIPKGTDLSKISLDELKQIVSIINGKPRRSLGYRTALEVATSAGILLENEVS